MLLQNKQQLRTDNWEQVEAQSRYHIYINFLYENEYNWNQRRSYQL